MRKLTVEEIAAQRVPPSLVANAERTPICAMLDNIRSLYNVGSMFRTSDGALIRKMYLAGYTPCPPRKEIEKTALGATQSVPWEHFSKPIDAVNVLRSEGIRICVLEHTTGSVPYFAVPPTAFPLCLVVGNEITGVSPEVVAAADLAIEIPMYGMKQSLNAAVAYGIALFELVRICKNVST
ncbi:MAG: rRNA methylase [Bacteroidetes bacterium]|nr:rRNA methylase [Bacteroidota bacterium]